MNDNKLNYVLTEVDPKGDIAHKDLFLTKGVRTTAASKVLDQYKAQYDSTVVARLDEAGYVTKAKLNCDAWAHGASGENSDYGPTKNPWDPTTVPGGSSSGSAAAVADGYVPVTTGTDTGGSIRLPSSFTGTTGIKPTYGALSRYGIVAMGSSLDSPGFIGTDVPTVRKAFDAVVGKDVHDATTWSPVRDAESTAYSQRPVQHLNIGLPKEYFGEGIEPEVADLVKAAAAQLEQEGHTLVDIELPHTKYGIAVYYLVMSTEVASNLGRYDGIRYGNNRSAMGAEAKRRIMLGTYASSAGYADKYYEKAAQVRTLLIQDFEKAFESVDVILGPVSPTPAFAIGSKDNDPLQMYLCDVLTGTINLAGLPSLALPCGTAKSGLPVGMQLIGPRWSEQFLFNLGEAYQKLTDWHTQVPVKEARG